MLLPQEKSILKSFNGDVHIYFLTILILHFHEFLQPQSVIRKWCDINCHPGFSDASFDTLKINWRKQDFNLLLAIG